MPVHTVFVQRSALRVTYSNSPGTVGAEKHVGIYVKCPSVLSEVKKNCNISTYFRITGDTKFSENLLHRLSSLNTADGRIYRRAERC